MVANVTHDNHFVPQWLLKRWSPDGLTIWTYALLVPHGNVPEWEPKPIKSSAFRRDLYTTLAGGQETDAIEKWLTSEFEEPGREASQRLLAENKLTKDDWHALIRLYALQEIRTPLSFMEFMRRWDEYLPDLIEKTLKEAIQVMSGSKASGIPLSDRMSHADRQRDDEFSRLLKISVEESQSDDETAMLGATVIAGRGLWMFAIRHLMQGRAMDKLLSQEWSIVTPAEGTNWPLTDHPSLRVGFRSEQDYSFGGGYGRRNTDLALPLSPHYLLHTMVGTRAQRYYRLSPEHTRIMQGLLVRRAFRFVYATARNELVSSLRPRRVDAGAYKAELAAWERWHSDQTDAESK
jgi:hypothetical protein